jgi:hypothetical protein
MPDEYKQQIKDPVRRGLETILSDTILEVTRAGEVVWDWHAYEHMDVNRYLESDLIDIPGGWNWTHFNCLQALPENRWYDEGDDRFKPGNILLSPRTLGLIFIVDKETKEIVWEYTGAYEGGLAGQHEPRMIPKGIPGEGNIIVLDNGTPPIRSIRHSAVSYVLEINPVTKVVEWKYEEGQFLKFYVPFGGSVERLANGNTLVGESFGSRVFEVTREGETVWEYAVERQWRNIHGFRYPYDYCPQLRVLGKPEEREVTPPDYVITRPHGTPLGEQFDITSQQKR